MTKLIMLMSLAAVAWGQWDDPVVSKKFKSQDATVVLYQILGDIVPTVVTKHEGDGMIVTVFYRVNVQVGGQKVDVLLSRTSICPLVPEATVGCDAISGLRLGDISWVQVKVFKSADVFDVGRKSEEAR